MKGCRYSTRGFFVKLFGFVFIIALTQVSCRRDDKGDPDIEHPNPRPQELVWPKKEIRAVWMATAWELDWPMQERGEEAQKALFNKYLDTFRNLNINTIFLQVRSMGDAFYESRYEPWSSVLTGVRGKNPGYDVLRFMLDEAHSRGLSVHAWINPFRLSTNGSVPLLKDTKAQEWITKIGNFVVYDPAEPEARQRVSDVVAELLSKYDFDGVHIDDYFYPDAQEIKPSDVEQYKKYGAGYPTVEDFRRGNVDKAVKAISDVVRRHKRSIPFTVSPASDQNYNYNTLYANIPKWCEEGWVDAIVPQLYHEIGHKTADFTSRLTMWSRYSQRASLLVGHGLYRFGDPASPAAFQSSKELTHQYNTARKIKKVVGHALYSAKYLHLNRVNVTSALKELYAKPALRPILGAVTGTVPPAPSHLSISSGALTWEGKGAYYAVYFLPDGSKEVSLLSITSAKRCLIEPARGRYYVTALSENDNESLPSSIQAN